MLFGFTAWRTTDKNGFTAFCGEVSHQVFVRITENVISPLVLVYSKYVCWRGFATRDYLHAVRYVRAAACRTTDCIGSSNQQQEIKKC
jgi:hypothetical protein